MPEVSDKPGETYIGKLITVEEVKFYLDYHCVDCRLKTTNECPGIYHRNGATRHKCAERC